MSPKKINLAIMGVLLVILIIIFWSSLNPKNIIFGTDFFTGGYPRRFLEYNEFKETGVFWLKWQPYVRGGVPGIESATYGDAFYPITMLLRILQVQPRLVQMFLYLIHLLLSGIFIYLLALDITKRWQAGLIAAISYMFTGSIFSLIYAGHEARMIINCLLPVTLYFLNRGLDRRELYYFALAAFTFGGSILCSHVQMAYYLGMMIIAFTIFKIFSNREQGINIPFIGSIVFVIIFILTAILPFIYPLLKYAPDTLRGIDRGYAFATSWSMPPEETLNLITPHFSGILDNYWGRNFFKLHTEYIGILPLILAFIAIFYAWKKRETKFFTGCAIFTLLFSWGGHTPIYRIFYHLLWGVNKFRAPAQIYYIFAFSITILAAIGVDHLIKGVKNDKKLRWILYSFGIITIIILILSLAKTPVISFAQGISPQKMQAIPNSVNKLQTGAFLGLIFVIISGVLINLLKKKKLTPVFFAIAGSIFIVIDLWLIGNHFYKTVEFNKYFGPDEVVQYLKTDQDRYRIFPYQQSNYPIVHGIETCGGENAAPLQRYQKFIGAKNTVMFNPTQLNNQHMLDVLNVKYIVHNKDLSQIFDFTKVYTGQGFSIFKNNSVIPRAVIYHNYEVMNEGMIISRIMSADFNPKQKVILEEDPGIERIEQDYTPVKITYYKPDSIKISYTSENDGILYLSDNYYRMWHASIDGKETKIYRANYTFRAIKAPKGEHKVKFWFDSPYINNGMVMMFIGYILTGIIVVCSLVLKRKRL